MAQDIGSRLAEARKKAGKSYEAIAAVCGVTAQTVKNWEADGPGPRVADAAALCDVLGVSASWLVFGREKRT